MNRRELLQLLVGQAREYGFAFRKWFTASTSIPWSGAEHALDWLARGQRANLLLFSHEFARHFFRAGERITFVVPQQNFQRVTPKGGTRTVERRAHLRRSSRKDVWQFHLREMAASEEPLRYIRRYLLVEETMAEAAAAAEVLSSEDKAPPEDEDNYDDELLVRDAG